jgi:hypothetical protein
MEPHWIKLRWPITVLILGGMASTLLVRISTHPIQLRLNLSFVQPLQVGGELKHSLTMQRPVQVEASSPMDLQVIHEAPMRLKMSHPDPIQVQVSEQKPMEVKVGEDQPMRVDVKPEGSVKVRLGL